MSRISPAKTNFLGFCTLTVLSGFLFPCSFACASYLQWFAEKTKNNDFPQSFVVESGPFEKTKTVLPAGCPIPEDKITVVLKAEGILLIVGGGGDYGMAIHDGIGWRYFAGKRYLPLDEIQKIAIDKHGSIWVKTREGRTKMYAKTMTLEQKAAFFLKRLKERHIKHGFVRELRLNVPGHPEKGGFLHHADNDGLWTSLYIAAESFRYAVTKDPGAKKNAKESLKALMRLQDITGIPGFFARSIVEKGEPEKFHYGGEWHIDSSGKWEWKGDTSSDEADGHFFAYAVYYDLAADEKEKEEIKRYIKRMMDHIMEHDWYLVDADGEPTTFGRWNPKEFKETAWGKFARGLNSLEIFSHLNVAYHITGDKKYRDALYGLIKEGYDQYTLAVKITTLPVFANHSDDELAVLGYEPFFRYEEDPAVLKPVRAGFQTWCGAELPERNPWFNFVCCLYSEEKNLCDAESGKDTLRDIPMDTLNWQMKNSHRADVEIISNDRFGVIQLKSVLPISERCFFKWNGNPYRPDECGDGNEEDDGTFFLLPYWMGRYHGFLNPAD